MLAAKPKERVRRPMRFRQTLFWDVDPKTIDAQRNAPYVIERIIEFGTDREIRWMWNTYSRSLIRDVVEHRRGLNDRKRSLWRLLTAGA